jgi:pimeloyl-ACP methyl ester carboxylesterase
MRITRISPFNKIIATLMMACFCHVAVAQQHKRPKSTKKSRPAAARSTPDAFNWAKWGQYSGQRFEVTTTDGVKLIGYYTPPRNTTATVVFLPMVANTMEHFWPLVQSLQQKGIGTLLYDHRGHGESSATLTGNLSYKNFTSENWQQLQPDFEQILDWEKAHVAANQETVLVGAGIGANIALVSAAAHPEIKTLVLLSPGINYKGIQPMPAAAMLGSRKVLIMCGSVDKYAADSSRKIAATARQSGASVKEVYLKGVVKDILHGSSLLVMPNYRSVANWITTGVYHQ